MDVSSIAASGKQADFVEQDQVGFAGLTSETFLKLMITQLQNQDPFEPVGNDELLSQLSQMRNLQSNIELADTLKSITASQQLSSAAAFIGTVVTGTTPDQKEITGVVDRAFVQDNQTFVGIGDAAVAVGDVTGINMFLPEG